MVFRYLKVMEFSLVLYLFGLLENFGDFSDSAAHLRLDFRDVSLYAGFSGSRGVWSSPMGSVQRPSE